MTTLARSRREAHWRERAATLVIFLVLGLGVGAWAAILPRIQAELSLSARDLGFTLLAVSMGAVVSTIVGGMLAPRIGTGRTTATMAFVTVVTLALPGLADSLGALIASGVAIGLSSGALDVAVNGHASDIEGRWRAPIMSSFHAAFSVGGLAGAALGGVLAAAGLSIAGQLGLPVVINLALVASAVPFLGPGRSAETGGMGLAWPERAAFGLCALALLSFLIEGAVVDWSGVYLAGTAGASLAEAASGYAAFSLAMTIGRLFGDAAVAALGPVRIIVVGGLVAAFGVGLALLVPVPLAGAAGFALAGLGVSNVVPVVFSAGGRYGSSPSAGVAMVAGVGYVGFLGGPPLIGAVATAVGLRAALVIVVVAAMLVAISGRFVGARRSA